MLSVAAVTAIAAWAYNVTGIVTDQNGEPLMDATVRVLQAKDSAFVKGGITDLDGNFRITDLKKGKYLVEANYIGYSKSYAPVEVAKSNVKMDTLKVAESSYMLKETTVIGVKIGRAHV